MTFVPVGQQELSSPKTAVTFCCVRITCPAASRTIHVTTVVPSGSCAGMSLLRLTQQLPVAVGLGIVGFEQADTVTSGGSDVNLSVFSCDPAVGSIGQLS